MAEVSLVKLPSRWMSPDLTVKSTLVQVMAWCHQATSHYLSQCWPSFISSYGMKKLQWVNAQPVSATFSLAVEPDSAAWLPRQISKHKSLQWKTKDDISGRRRHYGTCTDSQSWTTCLRLTQRAQHPDSKKTEALLTNRVSPGNWGTLQCTSKVST